MGRASQINYPVLNDVLTCASIHSFKLKQTKHGMIVLMLTHNTMIICCLQLFFDIERKNSFKSIFRLYGAHIIGWKGVLSKMYKKLDYRTTVLISGWQRKVLQLNIWVLYFCDGEKERGRKIFGERKYIFVEEKNNGQCKG